MKLSIKALFAIGLITLTGKISAQLSSTGKLFYLSFMEMEARSGGYPDSLLLFITSEVNTSVVIDNPRIGGTAFTKNITAGVVNRVSMDPNFYYPQGYEKPSSDIESKRSVRVVAKDPVNVYTLNLEQYRTDGTFVLPYESIPKAPEFYVAAYTPTQTASGGKYMPSEFVVVGMDANVQVEITPTTALESGKVAGTPFTITLSKGQIYQVQSKFTDGSASNSSSVGDLSGTRVRVINGCGKINLFSGMRSVRIPSNACGTAVDHLYTQVFPINILGRKHVLMPFMTNTKGYVFRVIATKPNTKISVNGVYIGSVRNAGTYYTQDITSAVAACVTADSPIYVIQYMKNGGTCSGTSGGYGDPAILIMPDQSQKLLKTVVGTATTNNMNRHYINILVATSAKNAVKLNGTLLSGASFVDVACAGHSYLQVNVANPSTNTVECDSGLIVVVYGMGQFESYSYCAGALFESLDFDFSVTRTSQCPNVPVTLKAITVVKNVKKYLWNFGDGFTDTGKSVVHSFKKTGSFYVVMQAIIQGACGTNDTITRSKIVTIKPGPLYNMPDTLFQCTNSLSMKFDAPINVKYLYKWQDSSVKSSYTATLPGKVWLRIRDTATNCILIDSTLVQQFNPVVAKIGYDTANKCNSQNFFALTDSSVYKSDSYKSSKWVLTRPKVKDSIVSLKRFRIRFDTLGAYPIKYTIISQNGCKDTTFATLNVVGFPSAVFTTQKPEYCQKELATFEDSSTGQGGIKTTYWDFGDGGTATGLKVTHSYLTYNTFKVRLITETTYNCRDTADSMIVVNPLPVMAMTATTNDVCKKANSFTFIEGTTLPKGSLFSNQWKYMKVVTGGVSILNNIKFTDTGNWIVRLYNTSDKGCTDSIKKTVYVAPEPVAKIAFTDSSLCFKGHFYDMNDASTVSKGTIASRKWTFSDATTSTAKTITKKTFATYGNYNVKMVVTTTTYNCKDSVTRSLKVNSSPLAQFAVNDSAQCLKGNDFTFTPNSTFNVAGVTANYNWTFGDASNSTIAVPSHKYASSNTFNVKFIISTSQGCADTATRKMVVDPNPVAAFTKSKDSACFGLYKFDFMNTTAFGGAFTSKWSLGDATTAATKDVVQKNYGSANTFNVKLVVTTNPQGCKDSVTQPVVLMPVPKADFTINNPNQCLAGNSFVFNNTTLLNGSTGMGYQWVFTPGSTFNTQNIANQIMADTGAYQIKLTSTSGFGCTDNITKNIYVAESPTVSISGYDECTGEDIQFTANGSINSGSIVSYNWTFGDGGTSKTQDPLHAYSTANTWNASCTVTSDKGCTAVGGPLSIQSFALPKANFDFEQLTSRGIETDHKLTFTGSGASGYLWTFYNGSTDFTGGPVFKTFTDTGRKAVKLWVINTDGCTDSITKLIYLKPELQMWISTSFTPNNDGLNETFGPSTIFGLSKFKMQIFDRWGGKLFESKDPKLPWDGRDNKGDQAPEGVYGYEISFRYIDGKIFVYQGTITLIR